MVGSAIVRLLEKIVGVTIFKRTRQQLDLRNEKAVIDYFNSHCPDIVVLAAAKVGGIQANIESPGDFLYDNLAIQNNVIENSRRVGVNKIIFLGSSCIYPRECRQPMQEEDLFSGPLEPTNEGYAIAKIAGLKLVEYYKRQHKMSGISLMPCNLYGTNDSFDPQHSHVLSALVRKFCDARENKTKEVTLWGTGKARREFMHVDDIARGVIHFFDQVDIEGFVNIGCGNDISIRELAEMISNEVGYKGNICWDKTKPDGMMRKCLDVSKMKQYGFKPSISLLEGVRQTISEYNKIRTKI